MYIDIYNDYKNGRVYCVYWMISVQASGSGYLL